MSDFTDQTVVITGGGTGIGRASALAFARRGANVVVNYSRSQAEAEGTAGEITALGRRALAIRADVSDDAAVRRMMERTVVELGSIDVLINNAGMTHNVPYDQLDELTEEKWNDIFAVNVKGTFFCSRAAIAQMRQQSGGQIINVSSIAATTARGSSIAYAASKAAISNMTKALALSEAPRIRVNAVAPGVVRTRWVADWEQYTEAHREATPLGRLAEPADVAGAIVSLAEAEFITGEVLAVDGGRLLNV